jgi:hypothetical protein
MNAMSKIKVGEASVAAAPDPAATAAVIGASPATVVRSRAKGAIAPVQIALVAAGVVTLAWGAWVTREVLGMGHRPPEIVKVQLQGLIGEYIRAEARSANPVERQSAETAAFMAELDKTVKSLASDGKVVLVNEAIVSGDVPDVTDEVRRELYAKVPLPRPAPTQNVENAMRNYLLGAGAPGAAGSAAPAASAGAAASAAPAPADAAGSPFAQSAQAPAPEQGAVYGSGN